MAQQDTIKEFLVALGFKVDQSSLKKFTSGIEEATKATVKLVATIEGAALAVGTGVAAAASSLENLYYAAQKSETSATNLKAISKAAENLGASSGEAVSAIRTIEEAIRYNPGKESLIQGLGVQTRDVNGNLRDTVEITKDLGKALAAQPDRYIGKKYADEIGLGDDMFRALTNPEFADEFQRQKNLVSQSGFDKAAKQAHEFMVELRNLGAFLERFGIQITSTLMQRFGVSLKSIEQWFQVNGPRITDRLGEILSMVLRLAESAAPMIMAVVDAFMTADKATDGWSTKIIALIALLKWFGAGSLLSALMSIVSGFVGMLAAINPITLAVTALSIAAIALFNDWQGWNDLPEIAKTALDGVIDLFNGFIDFLKNAGKLILAIFVGNGHDIHQAWSDLVGDLGKDWDGFVAWLADSGPRIMAAVQKAFMAAFDWLKGRIDAIWDAMSGGSISNKGSEAYSNALESIDRTVDQAVDKVKGSVVGQEVSAAVNGIANSAFGKLISRGEGDYNSVNRGAQGGYRSGTEDLEHMTVGQVMESQRQGQFNAAGRYQMIKGTLADAVKATNMPLDTKFDKNTQDKLFEEYLVNNKRKAIGDFIKGKSDDIHAAMKAAAMEWASVADPNTGQSFYAGQGNNRASISSNQMEAALRNARAGFSTQQLNATQQAPKLAAAERESGNNIQLAQNTTINVTGGDNPEATGRAVAGQQDRVNESLSRNFATMVR